MKTIVLIDNQKKDPDGRISGLVAARLTAGGCSVVGYVDGDPFPDGADAAVVLGGDGSIMRAARLCAPRDLPMITVNLGRVGYMGELDIDEIANIRRFFDGEYSIEERMMLSVVCGDGEPHYALNDAVISNGAISKMTSLELYCNGEHVSDYHSDGLIISTPTGSTAYSMSAGGPIIDPAIDCQRVTPVCSHSLSSRPIVFSPDAELSVKNVSREDVSVYLTLDGSINLPLANGASVRIKKADIKTKLIRLNHDGFYKRLGKKVN